LRTTSESIAAIADQLGFESPEYFARVFRKHMGCSPSAFR
ncbi:MAG: AraC family transcriptional regulator, partial [Clostridia bacterium]|nr:AraC family transcriptional regulator [Clostridia bacterium]